jgi:hypothetical protein
MQHCRSADKIAYADLCWLYSTSFSLGGALSFKQAAEDRLRLGTQQRQSEEVGDPSKNQADCCTGIPEVEFKDPVLLIDTYFCVFQPRPMIITLLRQVYLVLVNHRLSRDWNGMFWNRNISQKKPVLKHSSYPAFTKHGSITDRAVLEHLSLNSTSDVIWRKICEKGKEK